MNKARWSHSYTQFICHVDVYELDVPYQGQSTIEISYSPIACETMAFPKNGNFDNPPMEMKGHCPNAMLESMGYTIHD